MAAITPTTNLYLLQNPHNLSSQNQITFASATVQYEYYSSLTKLSVDNFTYQRKDYVIRYAACVDDILSYNYVMYQNENYTNKWFYAYVKNMRYVNDNMTEITIETDVFQTFQFDITFKPSFVEREHVNNDTVGAHTIPEGLETGEFICNAHIIDDAMDDITQDLCYIVSSAIELYGTQVGGKYPMATGQTYNGIFSATKYYRFDNAGVMQGKLQEIAGLGQIDGINGVFMAPKILAVRKTSGGQTLFEIEEKTTSTNYTNAISKQLTVDGYTPKNNKVLCHLYNYLMISNNNGGSYVYNYEDFSTANCGFTIKMAITPGCSIRMTPTNYKGVSEADEYSINMGKFPICSFPCDMYTNWLTQNSINVLGVQITTDDLNIGSSALGVLNGAASLASGNPAGALNVANSFLQVGNALIAKKQHELIPPQSRGNLNAGDVTTASNKNNFHFYKMSIRQEYAKIIDNYFSMYGYQVNSLKTPNIQGRRNWNYIKCIGANIEGLIPEFYLDEIKAMFNVGITLWHYPATFLDYSQPNDIV